MATSPDLRLIRDACHLALDVAFDGERADPPVPAPPGLRQMFGFRKLSKTSLTTIARAVDHDDDFRARVAAEATEEKVGRAGHLWLTRPEGWQEDAVWSAQPTAEADSVAVSKLRRERDGAEAKATRFQQAAEEAEAARRRAQDQLDEARRRTREAERSRREAEARRAEVAEERAQAVRSLKDVEADLASTRRDLKVARDATREAEADRLALQEQLAALESVAPSRVEQGPSAEQSTSTEPAVAVGEPVDLPGLRRALRTASGAVVDLARALDEAASSLDPPSSPTRSDRPDRSNPPVGGDRAVSSQQDRSRGAENRGGRRRPRRPATLPPGILEGSPEADRHLVTSGDVLLLVDGYNLARDRWTGLEPEEERRRTVRLLDEVQARSGARVMVVFDGVTGEVSPVASRSIAVRYSPTGTTADEVIAETLDSLPHDVAVVVVSSDREVADHARSSGATVLGSRAFLAATDR